MTSQRQLATAAEGDAVYCCHHGLLKSLHGVDKRGHQRLRMTGVLIELTDIGAAAKAAS